LKSDVVLMSETKCKTKIELTGKLTFQSDFSGKGGVAVIHNSSKAKKIKHINENIIWTTDRHDGALVHYLTVYTPPNNTEMADLTLRQLRWFLT